MKKEGKGNIQLAHHAVTWGIQTSKCVTYLKQQRATFVIDIIKVSSNSSYNKTWRFSQHGGSLMQ